MSMLERAAKALWRCEGERAERAGSIISGTGLSIEPYDECADSSWRPDARAALLAALDPEDPEVALVVVRAVYAAMGARDVRDTINRRVVNALREVVTNDPPDEGGAQE